MFKRSFWKKTCVCFVIILSVLYLLAIFTNDDKTDKKELSHSNEPHSQVVPKVTKIKTQGLARYIGVSNLAFSADFGRPTQVITSAENIEWQQYRWEDKTYMLVGINKYSAKICAIYLLGESPLASELKNGLKKRKLQQKFPLAMDLKLRSNEQTAQIKLNQTDIETKPLIAFKNGSYAVSYFSRVTKKVVAVEYLDKEELLRSGLYQVSSQTPLPVRYSTDVLSSDDQDTMIQGIWEVLTFERAQRKVAQLSQSEVATAVAQRISQTLENDPKKYLPKKQLQQYQRLKADRLNDVKVLQLKPNDISAQLLADAQVEAARFEIYISGPVVNPAQLVATTGKNQSFWNKILFSKNTKIGFDYENSCLIVVYDKNE